MDYDELKRYLEAPPCKAYRFFIFEHGMLPMASWMSRGGWFSFEGGDPLRGWRHSHFTRTGRCRDSLARAWKDVTVA